MIERRKLRMRIGVVLIAVGLVGAFFPEPAISDNIVEAILFYGTWIVFLLLGLWFMVRAAKEKRD